MKQVTLRKVSILGVVLMAASAVTAAVLPSNKSDDSQFAADGSVTTSTSPGVTGSRTCAPTAPAAVKNCHITAASGTTTVETPSVSKTTTIGDAS
jgi:hypothetical protein